MPERQVIEQSEAARALEQEVSAQMARLSEAGFEAAAELLDRLLHHRNYTAYWYAVRFRRLWQWAHEELTPELRWRYFSIVANGKADSLEPPTYAHQFNVMEYRMRCAEEKAEALSLELERLKKEKTKS